MRQFLFILKDRSGYVLMRPVHSALGKYMARDYWGTIMWYHRHGDTAWVDSGWAPDHWPDVIHLLQQSKRRYVGWSHMGWVYLIPIAELSGEKPLLSQLRKYQKRFTNTRIARFGWVPEDAPDDPEIPADRQVNGPELVHVNVTPPLVHINT